MATIKHPQVIWLASYPKSGNTWVRFLLANLIHGRIEESRLIHEITPVLERGIRPHQMHGSRKNFIKTHIAFNNGLPFLDNTVGALYIVRNPIDVLASNLNYFLLTRNIPEDLSDHEIAEISGQYIEKYISHQGDSRWLKIQYGSWISHVESWIGTSHPFNVWLLRYEDLHADPVTALTTLCQNFSLDKAEEDIRVAVENSTFDRMREIEEREIREQSIGMFYQGHDEANRRGLRFMNKGRRGAGKELLTEDQLERVIQAFAPMMDKLGYSS